jgi:hypothetical protein
VVPDAQPCDAKPERDTMVGVETQQVEIWRALSTIQVAQVVSGASRAVRTLALAGLRTRFPSAAEPELTARLAAITLGPALARQVYPQLANLET